MNNNPENKPPAIPAGYKIVHDANGWYVIPDNQAPKTPA